MTWQPLLALPARLLAPLLLLLLAFLLSGAHYWVELSRIGEVAETQMTQSLRERLGLEQTRLETRLGQGDRAVVRRLVSGLVLHEGVSHAWLVDGAGHVVAALARQELERPLAEALAGQTPPLRQAALAAVRENNAAILIVPIADEPVLLGHLPIRPNHHLLVRVDLTHALAARVHGAQGGLWREVATFMLLAALMAALLHMLWFRRVGQLTATVAALGAGRLDARTELTGRDELAEIGAAIDRMAGELQQHHGQLLQLSTLIEHSPVVAIAWRNEPGWPVSFVSANISQWGYRREELLSGQLKYVDIIHPDDLPCIKAEVAAHLADGPNEYRQEYRLRHADGHWLWIADRTWLSRDASGAVTGISGVLIDISEQHRLEEEQREQSKILREKNAELERFNRAMIGRELDMIRLKEQIKELTRQS